MLNGLRQRANSQIRKVAQQIEQTRGHWSDDRGRIHAKSVASLDARSEVRGPRSEVRDRLKKSRAAGTFFENGLPQDVCVKRFVAKRFPKCVMHQAQPERIAIKNIVKAAEAD